LARFYLNDCGEVANPCPIDPIHEVVEGSWYRLKGIHDVLAINHGRDAVIGAVIGTNIYHYTVLWKFGE